MNIDTLAKKIATGDQGAFEQLYAVMRTPVYAVCLGVVKNARQAEDLTQDTFVGVWENVGYFHGVGFETWILKIAKNKSLNVLRKAKREIATDFSENENAAGRYQLDGVETSVVLKAALDRLDDVSRKIVLMKNSGLKTKEIATILEMPRGTVSWKYTTALKTLKEILGKEGA